MKTRPSPEIIYFPEFEGSKRENERVEVDLEEYGVMRRPTS
jgi:hypothetical protein